MKQVTCRACGNTIEIGEQARFCRICGKPFEFETTLESEVIISPESDSIANSGTIIINNNMNDTLSPERQPALPQIRYKDSEIRSNVIATPAFMEKKSILKEQAEVSTETFKTQTEAKELNSLLIIDSQLSEPTGVLKPLAIGELLQERYRVEEFLPNLSGPNDNYYSFTDELYYSLCQQCGNTFNQAGDDFCSECGCFLISQKTYRGHETLALGKPMGEALITSAGITKINELIPTFINFIEPTNNRAYSLSLKLEGGNLLTNSRALPTTALMRWTAQLIALLAELHKNELVGCNFKPETLWVLPGDRLQILELRQLKMATDPVEFELDLQQIISILGYIVSKVVAPTTNEDNRSYQFAKRWQTALIEATALTNLAELQALWQSVQPLPPPRPISYLRSYKGWNAGLHRNNNEDAVLNLDLQLSSNLQTEAVGLYIVADGMGGHENGEVASALTLKVMYEHLSPSFLENRPISDDPDLLGIEDEQLQRLVAQSIQEVNQQILLQGQGRMGTTITMVLVHHSIAYIANVGDSRTYLWRGNELTQLTSDDSLVYCLMKSGDITRAEIYTHPERNKLLRSLGDSDLDSVNVIKKILVPGDWLLLCSDGLWEMVHDEEITTILTASVKAETACLKLVEAANSNGGEDNIGLIVVETN